MVKLARLFFLPLSLLILLTVAAPGKAAAFSFYAGTGDAYAWPKVFHLRISATELAYHSTFLAVTKIFDKGPLYTNFGAGVSMQGSADYGFMAGVGYQNPFFRVIGFRIDWSTFAGFKSYMTSQVSLGLTLNF
jgi:hypothetical protein